MTGYCISMMSSSFTAEISIGAALLPRQRPNFVAFEMVRTVCRTQPSAMLFGKGRSASLWGTPRKAEAGACYVVQGAIFPLLRRREDAHAYWGTGHRKRRLRRYSIHIALHIRGASAQVLLRCQCSSNTAHTRTQATATAGVACTVMHALARHASQKRKANEKLHAPLLSKGYGPVITFD